MIHVQETASYFFYQNQIHFIMRQNKLMDLLQNFNMKFMFNIGTWFRKL